MREIKNPLNYYVIIHTLEIRVNSNKKDFEGKKFPYVKSIRWDEDETIIEINANKYLDRKIKSFSLFKTIFKVILSELGIFEYTISRIDIALDTETEYEECYKINRFIIDMDSVRLNVSNVFASVHQKGSYCQYMLKSKNYHHVFYDKKAESKGKDSANSRTEIRYMKSIDNNSITPELALDTAVKNFTEISKFLNSATEDATEALFKLYNKENADNCSEKISSFTDFVIRHSYMILTKKIMSSLYKKCVTGKFSSWLNKFCKNNNRKIELPLNSDIQNRIKEYKDALIRYKNS